MNGAVGGMERKSPTEKMTWSYNYRRSILETEISLDNHFPGRKTGAIDKFVVIRKDHKNKIASALGA
ncbi:hypothetical protein ACTXT7_008208 [Hymenolepis weldensis]